MAGNYPDAPSWRMAIDRDGTQLYRIDNSNVITQLTTADIATLNNENNDYYNNGPQNNTCYLVFIFPELRDVDAYFYAANDGHTLTVEVSVNTTNGLDGTWSTITSAADVGRLGVVPAYRTNITSSTALAVRSIRFKQNAGNAQALTARAIHLYGEPAPGENPNRLALWHPTLNQRVTPAYFDWGNVPRNSSADRGFRVKNLSPSQSAASIRVAMEALTDSSPSVPAQHTLSQDGSSFLAQINIGTLGPGGLSGPLTLRRVTPSNATLSLWSFRVFAESTSWS